MPDVWIMTKPLMTAASSLPLHEAIYLQIVPGDIVDHFSSHVIRIPGLQTRLEAPRCGCRHAVCMPYGPLALSWPTL